MLVGQGHPEVGEDHGDHEDVVDRERLLDEIAREELERRLPARQMVGGHRRPAEPVLLVEEELGM